MAQQRQTIADWCREVIFAVTQDGSSCGALELFHESLAGKVTLHKYPITSNMEGLDTKDLGNMFFNVAKNHAAGLFNNQNYKICAYHAGEDQAYTEYPFVMKGQADMDGGTPDASKTGVLQQMMQFYGHGMDSIFQQQQSIFNAQNQIIGMFATQHAILAKENSDAVILAKDCIMREATREHEFQMELIKTKQRADLIASVSKMIPFALNALTGKEIVSEASADTSLINTLAENISPEQIEMIPQLFGPELGGFIAKRLRKHVDEKNMLNNTGMTEVKGNGSLS